MMHNDNCRKSFDALTNVNLQEHGNMNLPMMNKLLIIKMIAINTLYR